MLSAVSILPAVDSCLKNPSLKKDFSHFSPESQAKGKLEWGQSKSLFFCHLKKNRKIIQPQRFLQLLTHYLTLI